MPELDIGGGGMGGGGGGTIAGIPLKFVAIGAGALVVMYLLTRGKSGGSQDASGGVYGPALGPNASIALGSLESTVRQNQGALEQLFSHQAATLGDLSTSIQQDYGDLSSKLGTGFGGLTSQITQSQITQQQQGALFEAILRQIWGGQQGQSQQFLNDQQQQIIDTANAQVRQLQAANGG